MPEVSVPMTHKHSRQSVWCQCWRCLSLYDIQTQQKERISVSAGGVCLGHQNTTGRAYGVSAGGVCPYDIKTQQTECMVSVLDVFVYDIQTQQKECIGVNAGGVCLSL